MRGVRACLVLVVCWVAWERCHRCWLDRNRKDGTDHRLYRTVRTNILDRGGGEWLLEVLGQDPPLTEVLGQFPDLFRLGDLRHIILGELVNIIMGVTMVITVTRSTISVFMGTGVTWDIILIVESRSISCIRRWEGWCRGWFGWRQGFSSDSWGCRS